MVKGSFELEKLLRNLKKKGEWDEIDKAGVILMIVYLGFKFKEKKSCTSVTEGIMAYVDERSERSTTINKYIDYYVPIYEYVVDGKVFHAEAREYSNNSAKFQHGSKCTIKYNPNKPGECFINGKKCKKVLEYENEPEES